MKKIIKGRQLNTATAKMVGTVMIDENKDIVEQQIIVKNIDNHRQMLSYILNNRNTPHIV